LLTGKQKRYLRSLAHHLKPIFQIGKGGINENLIKQVNEALEKRELIKVSILQNAIEDKEELANELADRTNSELVQLIGSTIVLYKESVEHKEIQLP
jgi:RNA-binding protein